MIRTEPAYYLVMALYNMSWAFLLPGYALFLLSRGLDLFQINLVFAIYLIASFLFEVPTGAVADLAGRKTSFLLSCAVRAIAFGLYACATNFVDCLVAELVDAVGSTLASGAIEAWAVDGIRADGERRPADRFFARAQAVSRCAMIASSLIGGYLGALDIRLPWIAGTVGFVLTGVVGARVMREVFPSAGVRRRALLPTISAGLRTVWQAPVLLALCALTFAAAFGAMPVYQTWQPRLQDLTGKGTALMGWVAAFVQVAALAGSALLPRLLGYFPRAQLLMIALAWRGAALAVAAVVASFVPAVVGFLCLELGGAVSEPMLQAWMNEHVPPEQRATVLSVRAMAFTLGGGLGLICLGLVARAAGIPTAWLIAAVLLVLIAPNFVLLERRTSAARSSMGAVRAAAPLPPGAA